MRPASTTDEHDRFMDLALQEGRKAEPEGNIPVGSVVVRNGEVIGSGHNEARSGPDATAHAEVQAIRDACRRQATWDLTGATLYTSMEPCPMCCWAIVEAGIGRLVLGARHEGMREHAPVGRVDYHDYSVETLMDLTGRAIEVVTGVRTRECEQLRLAWKGPGSVAAPRGAWQTR